jgi:hypothetical protein
MRSGLAIVLSILAVLATGCGGEQEDAVERSAFVERLATLCDQAREDVEALGLPSEAGPSVIGKWAARGSRLVDALTNVEGGGAGERVQRKALVVALDQYYRGLAIGGAVYAKTKSAEAYTAAIDRAQAFLRSAEVVTAKLGVPECVRQPFADTGS